MRYFALSLLSVVLLILAACSGTGSTLPSSSQDNGLTAAATETGGLDGLPSIPLDEDVSGKASSELPPGGKPPASNWLEDLTAAAAAPRSDTCLNLCFDGIPLMILSDENPAFPEGTGVEKFAPFLFKHGAAHKVDIGEFAAGCLEEIAGWFGGFAADGSGVEKVFHVVWDGEVFG